MRIVVMHNAKSGTGNRAAHVSTLVSELNASGHDVTCLRVGEDRGPGELARIVADHDLLVISGGDGTVHHTLPVLATVRTPMYHFPLGTENLFSREFGMTRDVATLLRAIDRGEIREIDLATINNRLFSLMVSVGFDACVVERVAAARSRGVTRSAYVRAALAELASPRLPRCTIRVDGQAAVTGQPGLAIVANSRQYAARLDPARNADMCDGRLDVVFLPFSSIIGLSRWLLQIAAGTHLDSEAIVSRRCEHVEIECDTDAPLQTDGEAAGKARRLDMQVRPRAIRVLVPSP